MGSIKVFNLFTGKIHDTPAQFFNNCKHILSGNCYDAVSKSMLAKVHEAENGTFSHPVILAAAADPETNDGQNFTLQVGEWKNIRSLFYQEKDNVTGNSKWQVLPQEQKEKPRRKRILVTRKLN